GEMKVMEKNVIRLVAVQQLRAAYGIKTKNWNKNKAAVCKASASNSTKLFGASLESLPYYNMECGSVPSFLVDACMVLLAHVDTEGLFRKSGSILRLKALRAKLDAEEECLSTALPCDVAGLVKQFFRELPEPVLPAELQDAFLKAQQLPTQDDRTSATMLLSCVLPDKNLSVLRYFFDFLHNVSERSAENKMDSNNLSVILAPNLLHSGDGTEKMSANTEKRLKLHAAVVHCFIENAHSFGVLPQSLQEKIPAMMGCEAGSMSPSHNELEELDLNSGLKRKQRRSFGVFSSATPVIGTPASKRKLPLESGHSFGFSNKKRRSVKKSLGIDLLPNSLFSGNSTPGSAFSASGVLESSQNTLPSAAKSRRHSATSGRRKSRRLSGRHAVSRVESGKAGCFSPKVNKKEAPRKSLRLRFSLGKSSKESVSVGSESIGWRLATQDKLRIDWNHSAFYKCTNVNLPLPLSGSKYMSKSEDNLLTPQYEPRSHRTSWSGETPGGEPLFGGGSFTDTPMSVCLKSTSMSVPAIVVSKPPAAGGLPARLCCASSAESLESERSIAEPRTQTAPSAEDAGGSDLQAVVQDSNGSAEPEPSDSSPVSPPAAPSDHRSDASRLSAQHQNITFGQFEVAALTPLHIDSVVFDFSPRNKDDEGSLCVAEGSTVEQSDGEAEPVNCSRLIDALDIQSPARFKLGVSSSTPCKSKLQLGTPPKAGTEIRTVLSKEAFSPAKVQIQSPYSLRSSEAEKRRVADHIQHFNKLTLHSPRSSRANEAKSPLKFHRTPVRQAVRRINSLLGSSCRPTRLAGPPNSQSAQVAKALSLESGLSPRPPQQQTQAKSKKKPPPVPPRKRSSLGPKAKPCALEDVTNKVQPKTRAEAADPPGAAKPLAQQLAEKDMNHYRGSPRNPLNQVRLLSATKPVSF
uniref:Rho GTPase activating protein 11A n=1 Tax=Salarias fasciatus TaxID=181472 RepID=A0A672H6A2_SALFA